MASSSIGPSTGGDSRTITDDDGVSVTLRKVFTGGGERLEVYAPRIETTIYLDAMAIEGLSWSDADTLRDLTTDFYAPETIDDSEFESLDDVTTERDAEFKISNEFGLGVVAPVDDGDRARVEVRSPKVGYRNQLSVKTLEAITARGGAVFTQFLETPFGPKGHDH